DSRRKLVLSHRLVALCKAGNEEKHQYEEGKPKELRHRCGILSHLPLIITDAFRNTDCFACSFQVVHADDVCTVEDGGRHGCERAVEASFCGGGGSGFVGEDAADERLSRGADQQWVVEEGG